MQLGHCAHASRGDCTLRHVAVALERAERRRSRRCGSRPLVGRAGVTLIELMVSLVLLGIVAGGMMRIIVRQQKFYTGNSGVLDTRSNVRQGVAVLQSSLRGIRPQQDISPGGMGKTYLEFREPRGSSVICGIDVGRTTIVVPPPELSSGAGLTSWLQQPQLGDGVLVYNTETRTWIDGLPAANSITGTEPSEGSGTCTDLISGIDPAMSSADAARGWSITLANPLPAEVKPGASIRFFRHARYELMQASDGEWYLGYYDCSACTEDDLVPVSGPYLSKDADPPGLEFIYRDQLGNETTDPTALRRIEITLRSQSGSIIDMEGRARDFYQDSLTTSVTLRNF